MTTTAPHEHLKDFTFSGLKQITLEGEIEKNKRLKKSDIQSFKKWCEKQPHFPQDIRDELLALFLHVSNYSIERSKIYLDNFLTIRTHAPEIFSDRNPLGKEMQSAFEIANGGLMPFRDENGNVIAIKSLRPCDPSKFVYKDLLKMETMIQAFIARFVGITPGVVFVTDVQHFTMGHALRINLSTMKKHLAYIQEAAPINLVSSHIVNINPSFTWLFNTIKQFVKKDLLSKTYLHSSGYESLYEHIPKNLLPKDFGGDLEPLDNYFQELRKGVEDFASILVEEDLKYIIDETKRPGKAKNSSDVFGLEGSFKKLDID